MEAVFFVSRPEDARTVASIDDLPDGPASEAVVVDSPGAVSSLVTALGAEQSGGVRPLRDATCQSFPVWLFSREFCKALEALDDDDLDAVAWRWKTGAEEDLRDPDLFELAICLGELRDALRHREPEERLFVLLEEKAF